MADRGDSLPSSKLRELTQGVDPNVRLEPDAVNVRPHCRKHMRCTRKYKTAQSRPPVLSTQVLQDVADDFVDNLAAIACELALHRGGTTLEARDIQLALGAAHAQEKKSSEHSRSACQSSAVLNCAGCDWRPQRRTGACASSALATTLPS